MSSTIAKGVGMTQIGGLIHTSVLQDEGANRKEDLYIRSVSFSPDGKYIATGAEDKLIRVSKKKEMRDPLEVGKNTDICDMHRFGISKRSGFDMYFGAMSRTFIRWSSAGTGVFWCLGPATARCGCGTGRRTRRCMCSGSRIPRRKTLG